MKSSPISKGLFFGIVKRFWPLWLVFAGALALFVVVPASMDSASRIQNPDSLYSYGILSSWGGVRFSGFLVVFVASAGSALAVFEYLFKQTAATFYGSLPVTRSKLFASVYLAGFLPLLVLEILTFGVLCLIAVPVSADGAACCAMWLALVAGLTVVFYSMAVFCCMLTGNRFVAVVLYGLANFFVAGAASALASWGNMLVYGVQQLQGDSLAWASPAVGIARYCWNLFFWSGARAGEDVSLAGSWFALAAYVAAAIVLAFLAAWLNKRRNFERAGDSAAFSAVRPLFRFVAGVALALAFAGVMQLSSFVSGYSSLDDSCAVPLFVALAAGGALGALFAQMILERTARVWKSAWKSSLLMVCLSAAFVAGCAIDVLGVSRYVPDAGSVRSVTVSASDGDYGIRMSAKVEGAEGVALAMDLHRALIDIGSSAHPDGLASDGADISPLLDDMGAWTSKVVTISYDLGGGNSVERRYPSVWFRRGEQGALNDGAGGEAMGKLEALMNCDEVQGEWRRGLLLLSSYNAYMYLHGDYPKSSALYAENIDFTSEESIDFLDNALKVDAIENGACMVGIMEATTPGKFLGIQVCVVDYDQGSWNIDLNTERTPRCIEWLEQHKGISLV